MYLQSVLRIVFGVFFMMVCSQCSCNQERPADIKTEKNNDDKDKDPPSVMLIGQHGVGKTTHFNFLAQAKRSKTADKEKHKGNCYYRNTRADNLTEYTYSESAVSTTIQSKMGPFLLTDTPNISSDYFDLTDSTYSKPYNALLFMVDLSPSATVHDSESTVFLKYLADDLRVHAAKHHNKSGKNPFQTLYNDYRDKFIILLTHAPNKSKQVQKSKARILDIVKEEGFDPDRVIFVGYGFSEMVPGVKDHEPKRESLASQIYEMVKDMPKSKIDFIHGKSGSP